MKTICCEKEKLLLERSIISLKNDLPSIFARKEVEKLLGNVIASGTLANLASQGLGPACIKNGSRNVVYERETFLAWLKLYLQGGIKLIKTHYNQGDNNA